MVVSVAGMPKLSVQSATFGMRDKLRKSLIPVGQSFGHSVRNTARWKERDRCPAELLLPLGDGDGVVPALSRRE
jgi:hypothetical protein